MFGGGLVNENMNCDVCLPTVFESISWLFIGCLAGIIFIGIIYTIASLIIEINEIKKGE